MNRKIAALVSLLFFVIVSTAQAGDADPKVSPLTSPLFREAPPTSTVIRQTTYKNIRLIWVDAAQLLREIGMER